MLPERVLWPRAAPAAGGAQDTNKVLAVSRIMVAWQPVGMAMGAYDMAVRYAGQRFQFGAPLAGFQLTQDRLAKMLASIQVPPPWERTAAATASPGLCQKRCLHSGAVHARQPVQAKHYRAEFFTCCAVACPMLRSS